MHTKSFAKSTLNTDGLYRPDVPDWVAAKASKLFFFNIVRALKKEVHIWRIDLNPAEVIVDEVAAVLSSDERIRADRFHFEKHRRRFIVCRGVLRHILEYYLFTDPAEIVFSYSPQGKPALTTDKNGIGLNFNLSHSSDLALLAVTCKRSVGIDLEFIRSNTDAKQLAQRYFFRDEYLKIDLLPDNQHQYFFYGFWTLKEAYLKATGVGLADLENVAIDTFPWGYPTLRVNRDVSADFSSWYMFPFIPSQGYIAALAIEGKERPIRYFSWRHQKRHHPLES